MGQGLPCPGGARRDPGLQPGRKQEHQCEATLHPGIPARRERGASGSKCPAPSGHIERNQSAAHLVDVPETHLYITTISSSTIPRNCRHHAYAHADRSDEEHNTMIRPVRTGIQYSMAKWRNQ